MVYRDQQTNEYTTTEMSSPPPSSMFSTLVEDCQAAALEFAGTFMFLLLGLGGIQAAAGELAASSGVPTIEHVLYVATSMGFSLLVSAWLFYRVTGGLFNPNVTTALLLCGIIKPVRFVLYCTAQLLGAIAASAVILALTPGPLAVNTALGNQINPAQGVFIEMFITAALCIAVLMLAVEKHQATPFAPIGIGLTLFVSHLFAVFYTGASMNTARSFGPAAVTGFPYTKHWVYWLGPFLGSVLGAGFYTILKHFGYGRLNPGQDTVDSSKSPRDPLYWTREGRTDEYRHSAAISETEKMTSRKHMDGDTRTATGSPTNTVEQQRLDSIV